VRRLQTAYAEAHTETTKTALDDMRELFKQINTTRQYFKTVYLQRELSELSRMIVYTGILAVMVASVMVLTYDDAANTRLHPTLYYLLFSGALVAIQSPLAVLFSYAMRAATISRKTAAFGPFIPQEEQQQVSDSNDS
jgi:tellurite resistance protein TehA-like permease